jgi:hypothetical protein
MPKNWKEVNFEDEFTFSVPVGVSEVDAQGIDSSIGVWKGEDVTIRVDYGLFSDPLTSYSGRPNYEHLAEEIDGRAASIIGFDQSDGNRFVAVHFYDLAERGHAKLRKLTMVVEASQKVGRELSLEIIRSIRFADPNP